MNTRLLTWKPDLPDHRDYKYNESIGTLPQKVDLSRFCSVVENQGTLGSCTGNALTDALEFLSRRPYRNPKLYSLQLSRLFVYYNERMLEGTTRIDSGAQIRTGIKALKKFGVCVERYWPYDIKKFQRKPNKKAYSEARWFKINHYCRLSTLTDMKTCLALGFPFVFGFSVYESFMSDAVAKTGIVHLPKGHEQCFGGHAVMAVGYNDKTKRFKVKNSWGSDWGRKGYFSMPFEYLENRDLSDDFWTIKDDFWTSKRTVNHV